MDNDLLLRGIGWNQDDGYGNDPIHKLKDRHTCVHRKNADVFLIKAGGMGPYCHCRWKPAAIGR